MGQYDWSRLSEGHFIYVFNGSSQLGLPVAIFKQAYNTKS